MFYSRINFSSKNFNKKFFTNWELQFRNKIKFNLDVSYSFSQYNPTGIIHQKNTILRADPAISIEKWGTIIKAGASPVWVNKDEYKFYPNIHLQKKMIMREVLY